MSYHRVQRTENTLPNSITATVLTSERDKLVSPALREGSRDGEQPPRSHCPSLRRTFTLMGIMNPGLEGESTPRQQRTAAAVRLSTTDQNAAQPQFSYHPTPDRDIPYKSMKPSFYTKHQTTFNVFKRISNAATQATCDGPMPTLHVQGEETGRIEVAAIVFCGMVLAVAIERAACCVKTNRILPVSNKCCFFTVRMTPCYVQALSPHLSPLTRYANCLLLLPSRHNQHEPQPSNER